MEASNLGHFISVYEKFAAAENKSHRTIEAVTHAVKKFDIFLGDNSNPKDVKADELRLYILYLQERPKWAGHPTIKQDHGNLSPNAIAHHVRHIKAFWSWMASEGFIEDNALTYVKTPKETMRDVTPLLPIEVSQILKVIPRNNYKGYRNSAIIVALYGTLLRISELLDLPVSNVDFSSGQLKVTGKGDRERSVFMSPTAYKALYKYFSHWRPKVAKDFTLPDIKININYAAIFSVKLG